jgi:uncharacterized membrane protein
MQIIMHHKHATNITQAERWLSGFCGGMAAGIGLGRRDRAGLLLAVAGVEMMRRGLTGHSYLYEALGIRTAPVGQGAEVIAVPYELGIRVDQSVVIGVPRTELFRLWRRIEDLPQFFEYVEAVREIDPQTSHWIVKAPAGRRVEWDAVIHNEIENELIAWRTLPGGRVDHAGSVHFKDAPSGGTELSVELQYNPPAGTLGAAVAAVLGMEPGMMIERDLQRLKRILENPGVAAKIRRDQDIDDASEMSFPASDAPAW